MTQVPFPNRFQRFSAAAIATLTLVLNALPAGADPFRSSNPKPIGAKTEQAFEAMFKEGNYTKAEELLKTAETNEPLAHALEASIAYLKNDLSGLSTNAGETLKAAEGLKTSQPLRSHLYTAVGRFLEGGHIFASATNKVTATPQVLAKLQQVFTSLGEAEKIDRADPELNLIKGYMDLLLAVNLPFSNPDQAIQKLRTAQPTYLVNRGIALAYRDMKQPDKALPEVEAALKVSPNNPELFYLKAQLYRMKAIDTTGAQRTEFYNQSIKLFREAIAKANQLPTTITSQIDTEGCHTLADSQRQSRSQTCVGRSLQNWRTAQQPNARPTTPATRPTTPAARPAASPSRPAATPAAPRR
jgi:tetratricopeptide (TPR) repeat protein